jgi:hypothetical protein
MQSNSFVAIGVETPARGTAENGTVSFMPANDVKPVVPDYMEREDNEQKGRDSRLGVYAKLRMGEFWNGLVVPFLGFSEGGTEKSGYGSLFKHCLGGDTTAQEGATGQYNHMFYPVSDPWYGGHVYLDALTVNLNYYEGNAQRNHPYNGGRVGKLTFKQEVAMPLVIEAEFFGQKLDTNEAAISSPAFPAENLRFDYNNMIVRTGTINRTGSAPDYTDITSSAKQIKPKSLTLEVDPAYSDEQELDGTDTMGRTNVGKFKAKLTMEINYNDHDTAFSSVDEFNSYLAGQATIPILITWDTGIIAGSGGAKNHALIIDLPACNRLHGAPDIVDEGDPSIPLEFECLVDSTTLYALGILLQNSATAIL